MARTYTREAAISMDVRSGSCSPFAQRLNHTHSHARSPWVLGHSAVEPPVTASPQSKTEVALLAALRSRTG